MKKTRILWLSLLLVLALSACGTGKPIGDLLKGNTGVSEMSSSSPSESQTARGAIRDFRWVPVRKPAGLAPITFLRQVDAHGLDIRLPRFGIVCRFLAKAEMYLL